MIEEIKGLIIRLLQDLLEDLSLPVEGGANEQTVLFGTDGVLDSMALISLIADLEAEIADRYEKNITLASEQAMSRSKSPFRTVDSLAEYAVELLKD